MKKKTRNLREIQNVKTDLLKNLFFVKNQKKIEKKKEKNEKEIKRVKKRKKKSKKNTRKSEQCFFEK